MFYRLAVILGAIYFVLIAWPIFMVWSLIYGLSTFTNPIPIIKGVITESVSLFKELWHG